jgi:hypothetical protein
MRVRKGTWALNDTGKIVKAINKEIECWTCVAWMISHFC